MGLFDIQYGKQHNKTEQNKKVEMVKWCIEYEYNQKNYKVIDYFSINAVPADARKYIENKIGTFQFHLIRFYRY